MGSPAKLTPAQLTNLQQLTRDLPEIRRTVRIARDGAYAMSLPMRTNDVLLVELKREQ
jgi:xylan 1,4-beta-xylosidase